MKSSLISTKFRQRPASFIQGDPKAAPAVFFIGQESTKFAFTKYSRLKVLSDQHSIIIPAFMWMSNGMSSWFADTASPLLPCCDALLSAFGGTCDLHLLFLCLSHYIGHSVRHLEPTALECWINTQPLASTIRQTDRGFCSTGVEWSNEHEAKYLEYVARYRRNTNSRNSANLRLHRTLSVAVTYVS